MRILFAVTFRAYRFRLRPSTKQRASLETTLELCRQLYNAALEEKRDAYKKQGIGLNCATQQAELTELKLLCPEYAEVYGQVLQNVLKRLHRAFDSFFRRVKTGQTPGYPRFKSADRYDSFTFPQVSGLDRKPSVKVRGVERLPTGRLKVHGVPGDLKVIWHREMLGIPKTATFKREGGHWYVFFSCDDVPIEEREKTGSVCGVDLGIESFATLDDGTHVENPRLLKSAWRAVLATERKMTRRKRGSNRRRKARALFAKAHRRVASGRRDFHHKVARMVVSKYDRIAVEDLNIAGLACSVLAKSVRDVGWGQFLAILSSKAEGAGVQVVKVSASGTSQECAACGAKVPKALSERVHRCPECGYTAHRDVNAALNIRQRAFGNNGPGSGLRGGTSAGPRLATREACAVDPRSPKRKRGESSRRVQTRSETKGSSR